MDKVSVRARTTDPDTSHQAAMDFEANQAKAQRSVRVVVEILSTHGELDDFQILALWPRFWLDGFSESLPRKARRWAWEQRLVSSAGYGKHKGRKVCRWRVGDDGLPRERGPSQVETRFLEGRVTALERALRSIVKMTREIPVREAASSALNGRGR